MAKKWKVPPCVEQILAQLEQAGFEGYLVGGCVRDHLMGRQPHDYDITTNALPQQSIALFGEEKVIQTGLQHGTVTVRTPQGGVEVTTYRQDGIYTDHRRPDRVSFTRSLPQDLARRDFTVNAMAMDRRGNLVDPFGGRADLQEGLLRCVGEPGQRFEEDALRILRGLRFAARFGFAIEPQTAKAMNEKKPLLAYVAAERIYTELCGLLTGPYWTEVLDRHLPVLRAVLPELSSVSHLCRWGALPQQLSLRFAALLAEGTKEEAEGVLSRLKAPKSLQKEVLLLVESFSVPCPADRGAVHGQMARLGAQGFSNLLALWQAAGHPVDPLYELQQQLLGEGACLSLKELAVTGADLMALGYRGVEVGQLLNHLFEQVVGEQLPNNKEILLKSIKP